MNLTYLVVCPPDSPPVQCLISPCSLPPPEGCVFATCEDDFCGGCNRHYFDANKTEVCKGGNKVINTELIEFQNAPMLNAVRNPSYPHFSVLMDPSEG
jgi:hypothetical protein